MSLSDGKVCDSLNARVEVALIELVFVASPRSDRILSKHEIKSRLLGNVDMILSEPWLRGVYDGGLAGDCQIRLVPAITSR